MHNDIVQVGDVIKLRPSIFEMELQYSEWSAKYLYEDTFQHISLRFNKLGQPGDMAKTIFGSSETVVEAIENDEDGLPWIVDGLPFILLTDKFRIIYSEALNNNELSVISRSSSSSCKNILSEKQLIQDLEFFEQEYLNGLFNVMERENNKAAMYRTGFYLMQREGKWGS